MKHSAGFPAPQFRSDLKGWQGRASIPIPWSPAARTCLVSACVLCFCRSGAGLSPSLISQCQNYIFCMVITRSAFKLITWRRKSLPSGWLHELFPLLLLLLLLFYFIIVLLLYLGALFCISFLLTVACCVSSY